MLGSLVGSERWIRDSSSSFMTGEVIVVDGGRSLLDVVDAPAH